MSARILVVDDEPDVETLILQRFRYKIRDEAVSFVFARDGVEALATLKADGNIDLVVTDINMPRMDGLSLLQKLQESEQNVSTIVVSAYGDMANIRSAMNRGAFDFVTKPIDFLDLEATIAKTLRHIEFLRNARQCQAAAERAYASLSRYFSPNLAQRLASDGDAVDLDGQRREIATLFTDITNFTALVETLDPSVLGPLLNEYLTGMSDIVLGCIGGDGPERRRCCLRDGRNQHLRIRVLRPHEHLVGRAALDDAAAAHNQNAVGDLGHDPEIVGNEQDAAFVPRPQLLEELEDLRLRRDVQGRGRLVRDDEGRFERKRHCDQKGLQRVSGAGVHREYEDACIGVELANMLNRVDAAAARHRNIHDDHVRLCILVALITSPAKDNSQDA
jgi:CheY-like chemotaxis protein